MSEGMPLMGVAMLAASAALLVGCLTAVIWPPHDCGQVGCSQRSNRWHRHP